MEKDALKRELIGTRIEVIDSKNSKLIGIAGTIVDETRNMITVRTEEGTKRLIKEQITFTINGGAKIDGKDIIYRPEDRIKRI